MVKRPLKKRTKAKRPLKTRKSTKKAGFWGKTRTERERLDRRFEEVPLDQLTPWEDNPRINEHVVPRLCELIKEHGFAGVIIATPDGVIRAGNTRYLAVKELGWETIPVEWRNFESEEAAEQYALADNKSGEWAEWDNKKLAKLFKKRASVDLEKWERATGFSKTEIEWQGAPAVDPDALPEWEETEDSLFVLRATQIKGTDKNKVLDEVNKVLKPYGYEAKVY